MASPSTLPRALDADPAEDAAANEAAVRPDGPCRAIGRALSRLEDAFGQSFVLLDVRTGQPQNAAGFQVGWDFDSRLEAMAELARREQTDIVEHEPPLSMLVVPLAKLERGASLVASTVLLTMRVDQQTEIAAAARVFGVDPGRALAWARHAEPWTTRAALRLAEATLETVVQRTQVDYLEHEIIEAVAHARDTYAELGLLHRLMRRLTLSDDDGQLWRRAAKWLAESVPAECLAIVPNRADEVNAARLGRPAPEVIQGHCPLPVGDLAELIARLGSAVQRPLLLSRFHTSAITWGYPTVRELACTPILDGSRVEGWLVALNHSGETDAAVCEFGSAEIRLMESVSTILGVHRSNTGLFHRQADLFGAAVRALITAIEAKDRYTHGHSERVARVAVCLANELRLSKGDVNAIYLGGMLHDIGKIGVDNQLLNKPGALTPEEFEQVKRHPQLGHDILCGMRQLERILPIVLHHHEAWDGSGYPHGLAGEETPLLARVTAVADAYDAMASDRPYRRGMPDEKLDAIFREGAGRQWDPQVVDAFFAARNRVREAARDAALEAIPLDVMSWVD